MILLSGLLKLKLELRFVILVFAGLLFCCFA